MAREEHALEGDLAVYGGYGLVQPDEEGHAIPPLEACS